MNSLMGRDPMRSVDPLQRAMNRLWDDPLVRFSRDLASGAPALDMYETDTEIVISAAIPGVKPEDVQITVVGDTVQIRGEVKSEEEKKDKSYIYRERSFGEFSRTLTLPSYAASDKATAEFEHGVLKLVIPKTEEQQPKVIKVKSK